MMKKLIPFVHEMLVLLLCIIGIVTGLYLGDFFEISIRPHLLPLSACVIFLIVVMWLLVPVFSRGVKALVDILFCAVTEISGKILAVMPMDASPFSERFGKEYEQLRDNRYRIVIQTRINLREIQLSLISTEYPEHKKGGNYVFTVSRFAKVLIDISEQDRGQGAVCVNPTNRDKGKVLPSPKKDPR